MAQITRCLGGCDQEILKNREDNYLLSELATMLPGKPHYFTVLRWYRDGVEGPKCLVKLEGIRSPGGTRSSIEAYYRFLERLNDGYARD